MTGLDGDLQEEGESWCDFDGDLCSLCSGERRGDIVSDKAENCNENTTQIAKTKSEDDEHFILFFRFASVLSVLLSIYTFTETALGRHQREGETVIRHFPIHCLIRPFPFIVIISQ